MSNRFVLFYEYDYEYTKFSMLCICCQMIKSNGYMMKQVWENGVLKQDIEAIEDGDDEGISLVIRDKENIENVRLPRDALLRAIFQEEPSSNSLMSRLKVMTENVDKKSGHRKTQCKKLHKDSKNKRVNLTKKHKKKNISCKCSK